MQSADKKLQKMLGRIQGMALASAQYCGFMCFTFLYASKLENDESLDLLVNCPWSITKGGRLVTLTEESALEKDKFLRGVLDPILGIPMKECMEQTDGQHVEASSGVTLPSRRIDLAFQCRLDRRELVVRSVTMMKSRAILIEMACGYSLHIMPSDPDSDFHWSIQDDAQDESVYCAGDRSAIQEW